MKIRCPADDPRDPGCHVAVDVRMPMPIGRAMTLLGQLKCPCGKGLVIDMRPETPCVSGVRS